MPTLPRLPKLAGQNVHLSTLGRTWRVAGNAPKIMAILAFLAFLAMK
jgi:hypothetical protein